MVNWIGLLEIRMRRFQAAWKDLYQDLAVPQSVEFMNTLTAAERPAIQQLSN